MSRDSIIFGISGVFFGILVGSIIGSQQGAGARPAAVPDAAQAATSTPGQATVKPLDEARAAALSQAATSNPRDVQTRLDLGNLYFDAERFADAAKLVRAGTLHRPSQRERQHRSRHRLLLHEPAG